MGSGKGGIPLHFLKESVDEPPLSARPIRQEPGEEEVHDNGEMPAQDEVLEKYQMKTRDEQALDFEDEVYSEGGQSSFSEGDDEDQVLPLPCTRALPPPTMPGRTRTKPSTKVLSLSAPPPLSLAPSTALNHCQPLSTAVNRHQPPAVVHERPPIDSYRRVQCGKASSATPNAPLGTHNTPQPLSRTPGSVLPQPPCPSPISFHKSLHFSCFSCFTAIRFACLCTCPL